MQDYLRFVTACTGAYRRDKESVVSGFAHGIPDPPFHQYVKGVILDTLSYEQDDAIESH
jgi:hypothetical protein